MSDTVIELAILFARQCLPDKSCLMRNHYAAPMSSFDCLEAPPFTRGH